MTEQKASFENTENAFAYKSNPELRKARFLFKTMGNPFLVRWGIKLTPLAMRMKLPIKGIIRRTIFSQFVGGETLEETAAVAQKLARYHVQAILDYGVEGGNNGEEGFDHACEEFMRLRPDVRVDQGIPVDLEKNPELKEFLEELGKGKSKGVGGP